VDFVNAQAELFECFPGNPKIGRARSATARASRATFKAPDIERNVRSAARPRDDSPAKAGVDFEAVARTFEVSPRSLFREVVLFHGVSLCALLGYALSF